MPRPWRWTAVALAACLATTLTAGPAPAAPSDPPAPDSATAGQPGETTAVTLITGDVVEVADAGADRFAGTVQPGPAREAITFHTLEVDGSTLVLPSDVVPYVSAGVLDRRLFDVPQLIAQGYDDESTAQLPLIVRYDGGQAPASSEAAPLAGATAADLGSIDAAALAVARDQLGGVWEMVSGGEQPAAAAARSSLAAGVSEIWLDGRVEPALEHSVPQIGAPQVWDAGYDGSGTTIAVLDTGVDGDHPDLTGAVADARNFTTSPDVEDRLGHGTHVAATAAGSGALDGVAPGAAVLSGKVLGDNGFGQESWIIEGMEWAVAQDADVVNLSLGGGATDGTDPLSRAVDRLSDESDALFVISAGNDGLDYTVGSPGAASSALTVGAVDRDEELAGFSSRGPRLGDDAIKPEITAPGVGIVAARADGTALGSPVDEHYTAASGTSMAAPHVAGVAALLAQARPDHAGERLKDALVSTAVAHPDLTVFAQGGGRVDAPRAVTQGVYGTGVVNFGVHTSTGSPKEQQHDLVYRNDTDQPVTLDLALELHNLDGEDAPGTPLTLDTDQATVAAGATAAVPVRLDPGELTRGRHTGRITATGPDGVQVRTTVGATLMGPQHTVTLRAVAADGSPTGASVVALHGDMPRSDHLMWIPDGQEITVEVQEGTYLLHGLIRTYDPQFEQANLVTDPEVEVTGDVEVVLDARDAVPVQIETPKPSEQRETFSYYVHRAMPNDRTISHGVMHFSTVRQLNVTPTEPVSEGTYEFSSRWQLVAPLVDAAVPGMPDDPRLTILHRSPVFDGTRRLPLVYAGTGTEEELAEVDAAGAAVVMDSRADAPERVQLDAAAQAGAEAAVIVRPPEFAPWTVWRPTGARDPVAGFVMGYDEGQALIDHATSAGNPRIHLAVTPDSPYLYDVQHVEHGRVPDEITHRVTPANSARFTVGYTDQGGFEWAKEQRFGWRPWQTYSWNDDQRFMRAGTTREEWVSAGDNLWQHRVHHEYTWDEMNPLQGGIVEHPRSYDAGRADDVTWHQPLVRPAAPAGVPEAVSRRAGDRMELRVPEFVDPYGHYGTAWGSEVQARLLRDGEVQAELPDARRDVLVGPDPAAYRLELATERDYAEWQWATRTETAWEFRSQRTEEPQPLRMLQVDYDVPVDLAGRVSGHRAHWLSLDVRHQDGLPAPESAAVTLAVSYDEGGSWRDVPVRRVGGQWRAFVAPRGDTVSLRMHAEAGDGSEVTQTVIRAYGIR